MKVNMRTIKNDIPKLIKSAEQLNSSTVNVGVLKGENAWLAGIHEYGCRIPVTPRMRAYLHRRGIHLKKSTKEIVIPERSFIRAGFDANESDITELISRWGQLVMSGTVSADEAFNRVGQEVADLIADFAIKLSSPANSSWTIGDKGSSNPLVDSGDMIGGITYEVK